MSPVKSVSPFVVFCCSAHNLNMIFELLWVWWCESAWFKRTFPPQFILKFTHSPYLNEIVFSLTGDVLLNFVAHIVTLNFNDHGSRVFCLSFKSWIFTFIIFIKTIQMNCWLAEQSGNLWMCSNLKFLYEM